MRRRCLTGSVMRPVFGVRNHGPSSALSRPLSAAQAWNGATAIESAARQPRLDLLEKAVALLSVIPAPKLSQFVQIAATRLETIRDSVFACIALCRLAIAIADFPDSEASFAGLSEQAEVLLKDLPQGGGRLSAASYVLAMKAKSHNPPNLLSAAMAELSSAGEYFRSWRWVCLRDSAERRMGAAHFSCSRLHGCSLASWV